MRESASGKLFNIFNYTFLSVMTLTFIVPFLILLSTSLVSEQELIRRGSFILIPEKIDVTAYKTLLSQGSALYKSYWISILRTTVGTSLNLIFTATMAYGISRTTLPGRNIIITLVFISMLFSGGLVPTYLLMKFLHLTNTFWVMILPSLISAWYLLIMKSFFSQIPESLEESAVLDGASPLRVLVSIIVPISMPMLVTIGLFYGVTHWNAWFDATIYITNPDLMPVQVFLRRIVLTMTNQDLDSAILLNMNERATPQALRGAMIMITTVPIMCVYPFLQKHFIKGVLVGSVKG
ncbi:carbohydrate ABC transporter permease [Paenibacillus eucommiae]|uniref:Aldouronate transport system permease protein n=1 Tax=Paenibacillus eucommiae TaxID=1355755 RepID=A0ABS4J4N4_9BACL|nr:carbohydrate ABC transporter permease [Paenibacillus eucommiae]MBP1994061.1 putative aldouronate transport system permease protein [Paenibacillus eucommiae]